MWRSIMMWRTSRSMQASCSCVAARPACCAWSSTQQPLLPVRLHWLQGVAVVRRSGVSHTTPLRVQFELCCSQLPCQNSWNPAVSHSIFCWLFSGLVSLAPALLAMATPVRCSHSASTSAPRASAARSMPAVVAPVRAGNTLGVSRCARCSLKHSATA